MCGLIAMRTLSPRSEQVEAVNRLFRESKVRGVHAFGFSYLHGTQIQTQKAHRLEHLQDMLYELNYFPPKLLIGHTRYSTSGDYLNHDNNQPLEVGRMALAFNGVISQATREQNEQRFGKKLQWDNDGEIFCRKVLDGDDVVKFVVEGKFSFAGVYILNGELYVLRNKRRPLWLAKSCGATFIASTKDIFARAGGFDDVHEVTPDKLFWIEPS